MNNRLFPFGWWMDGADLRPHLRDNNHTGLFQHLDKTKAAAHLVMDDLGLAVRIKARYPDAVVIFRKFSGHQGGEWQQYPDAKEFARYLANFGEPQILKYLSNEPKFNSSNFKEWANHEAETVRELNRLGHTALACNTGVGRYQPEWIQRGDLDKLIHAVMADPRNRFGPHEYQTLSLAAGFIDPSEWYDSDTDSIPDAMKPENWPKPEIIPSYGQFHLLFRHVNILKRCLELGYTMAQLIGRFIIGEFGYDNTPDGNNKVLTAMINTLRLRFGIERYNHDMRGVNTYDRYRKNAWPERSTSEQIILEFRYILDLIEQQCPWIAAVLPYGLNHDWEYPSEGFEQGQHTPSGHGYGIEWRWNEFAPLLEELAQEYRMSTPELEPIEEIPIPSPDDFFWESGTFTFNRNNFRSQPTIDDNVIQELDGEHRGRRAYQSSRIGDGHSWKAIHVESLDKYGWIAVWESSNPNVEFFTFEPDKSIPSEPESPPLVDSEKKYFVDLGTLTITLTETDRLFHLDEARNKLEYIQLRISALENARLIEGDS